MKDWLPNEFTVALLVAAVLVLLLSGGTFGNPAPFKTDKLAVLVAYDADPEAMQALDKAHPGQDDIMASLAEGSARAWVKNQGGEWRLMPKANADASMDEQWVQDAVAAWKAKGGAVPWVVAANPTTGVNQSLPENQAAMLSLLAPLGVK